MGGVADFPWARVHVSRRQLALIEPTLRHGLSRRLHPAQWRHGPRWAPADLDETFLGRPSSRILGGLRLVALEGHIAGHCGVVVHRDGEPDLIHAGDAIFASRTPDGRLAPIGLALFERRMRTDVRAWRRSRAWLRDRHAEGAEIVCGHEPLADPGVHGGV